MNKKGFTLVELLAVIAILAILVIIALPNVLEMYRSARKNTFLREVASVYDAAHTKYFLGAFGGTTTTKKYSNIKKTNNPDQYLDGTERLDLQGGNDAFLYCIILDSQGKVTTLHVSHGAYKYENKKGNPLTVFNIDDIKDVNNGTVTENTTSTPATLTACG